MVTVTALCILFVAALIVWHPYRSKVDNWTEVITASFVLMSFIVLSVKFSAENCALSAALNVAAAACQHILFLLVKVNHFIPDSLDGETILTLNMVSIGGRMISMSVKGIFSGIQFLHELAENTSATAIQRVYRGYRGRRLKILQLMYPECSGKSILVVNRITLRAQKIRRLKIRCVGGNYLRWYTGPWPTRIRIEKEEDVAYTESPLFHPARCTKSVEMNTGWFVNLSLIKPGGWFRHSDNVPSIEHATVAATIRRYDAEVLLQEPSQPQQATKGTSFGLSAICNARVIAEGIHKYAAEFARKESSRLAGAGLESMCENVLTAAAIQQNATIDAEIELERAIAAPVHAQHVQAQAGLESMRANVLTAAAIQQNATIDADNKQAAVAKRVQAQAGLESMRANVLTAAAIQQHATVEADNAIVTEEEEEVLIDAASVHHELSRVSSKNMSEIRVLLNPPAAIRQCLMVRYCL